MNQLNFNTEKRNFKHLSEYERGEIYAMVELGHSISSIARHLNRSRTTIYNELKRGRVEQIRNGHKVTVYYPDAGQTQYEKNRKNSKKKFKVLECVDFIKFVEELFKKQCWSLDECYGRAKSDKLFKNTVCTKTLYKYVELGFLKMKNTDLPQKLKRIPKSTRIRINKRKFGKSISERSKHIELRKEFGHWEIDTVIGKKTSDQDVLLTIIERKSRYYKVIKIDSKSSKRVNDALLDFIMESKTKVAEVFKSITSDNGSEFSGLSELESLVAMYFCHPYSSFERGSNERHNGILRQFIPKGRSINDFSEDEIMYFVDIINAKPRKNLGYRIPEEIFDEEMDKIYSTSGVA
nr:IS30 family transposase [uncultured Peptostreptococcus sp.]